MVGMIMIGIFVASVRLLMDRHSLRKLVKKQRIQFSAAYLIGYAIIFGIGAWLMDWSETLAVHSIVQTIIFFGLFFIVFFAVHVLLVYIAPVSDKEEAS